MKYEIMLIVDGRLEVGEANSVAKDLISKVTNATSLETTEHGLNELAYEINKTSKGYYFQYNFEADTAEGINEFRRLALISKKVLRHLIINLEKDYGYRAANNQTKIERNKKREEIYVKRQEELRKRRELWQAQQAAGQPEYEVQTKSEGKAESAAKQAEAKASE